MPKMKRLELHSKLLEILGTSAVYFQPPETVKLEYPCIIYRLNYENGKHANDEPYIMHFMYSVTLITKDPDSELVEKMASIQGVNFDRYYTADNLHHYTYQVTMH